MTKRASDTNARVAALLRDLAAAQTDRQKRWGYRRAAAAVLALDEPLEALRQPDGSLRKIPHIGPSSTRVILEALATGTSAIVERAVAGSAERGAVERRRTLRHHYLSRAQVNAVLADPARGGPGPADYRGDLQMHSVWSDGRDSLAQLVEGCLARGYGYCAITDHGPGLPIARGVSTSALRRQHAEIDAINRRYRGRFRLLKGIEANIDASGALDLTRAERRRLDVVVAAPHSRLRTADDQTTRLVAAVATPGVHILAHPRGRKIGERPGIAADWDLVFAAARETGVAIEIDGDPSRQDIDFELAARALDAGCLFALDSDAHSVSELDYAEIAIAHARLAGIPPARIVNCWSLDKLLEWLAEAWAGIRMRGSGIRGIRATGSGIRDRKRDRKRSEARSGVAR